MAALCCICQTGMCLWILLTINLTLIIRIGTPRWMKRQLQIIKHGEGIKIESLASKVLKRSASKQPISKRQIISRKNNVVIYTAGLPLDVSNAYDSLKSELPREHPLFPHKDLPMLVGELLKRSGSVPDFFSKLDDWMAHNIAYKWAKQQNEGYALRTGEEVFEQKTGICSERAFITVAIARMLGYDSHFAIRSPKSTHSMPYEHGLAVIKLGDNHIIYNEACGYFEHNKHDNRELSDKTLEENFKKWREGNFNWVQWP